MSKASVSWDTLLRAREEWERNERLRRQAKRLEEKKKEDALNSQRDADLLRAGFVPAHFSSPHCCLHIRTLSVGDGEPTDKVQFLFTRKADCTSPTIRNISLRPYLAIDNYMHFLAQHNKQKRCAELVTEPQRRTAITLTAHPTTAAPTSRHQQIPKHQPLSPPFHRSATSRTAMVAPSAARRASS